jgi:hypothetical protein
MPPLHPPFPSALQSPPLLTSASHLRFFLSHSTLAFVRFGGAALGPRQENRGAGSSPRFVFVGQLSFLLEAVAHLRCASCHGVRGIAGDPEAKVLAPDPPPPLARLGAISLRARTILEFGQFEFLAVLRAVVGRVGGFDWGENFLQFRIDAA